DPYVTRLAKKAALESGRDVYVAMKKSTKRKQSEIVAYWVPSDVMPAVRQAAAATAESRAAKSEKARASRERRHERDLVRLAGRLAELYPGLPERKRAGIVRHAFEVGSDRVGRTTRLEEDRKLELAVLAHARHHHTDYDDRLNAGEERED